VRLFVAVYPPLFAIEDATDAVARLSIGRAAAGGINVRLAPAEQMHVTLAFLGEVPEARRHDAEAAVGAGVHRWLTDHSQRPAGRWGRSRRPAPAERATRPEAVPETPAVAGAGQSVRRPPIRLRVAGGGRFGRGRFTVLWMGLAGDVPALRDLAGDVRREVRRVRLPLDDKPLSPHLTIARPGDRVPAEDVVADLATLEDHEGPQWSVDEVRLMRSYVGPRPHYECVASFAVNPTALEG
jgi:2'-5' RNA ligase